MDGTHSILLVEDQQSLRRLMVEMLSGDGYAVREAGSAAEGLNAFESSPDSFQLAIIDMVLPGTSGLDLAAELSRRRPDLKVLYMSGYGESVAMESVRSFAPECVLIKPFGQSQLLNSVRRLLGTGLDLRNDVRGTGPV